MLAGMLSVITDEGKLSSPLPAFLRRKGRKRAAEGLTSRRASILQCPGSTARSWFCVQTVTLTVCVSYVVLSSHPVAGSSLLKPGLLSCLKDLK